MSLQSKHLQSLQLKHLKLLQKKHQKHLKLLLKKLLKKLHKLHKRILIPLLQTNPGVPVHVVTTSYGPPGRMRRIPVTVRVSHALPIDVDTMSPDTIVEMLRETMLQLSGQTYVDRYARDVKARDTGSARC